MLSSEFENQVAIITGAGQGIGFAIAKALAIQGCSIVLNDVSSTAAESACNKIQNEGANCIAVSGDAGDLKCIEKIIDAAVNHFGNVTICVPNAGVTLFDNFLSFKEDSFDRVMQTNLKGGFFLAQTFAKQVIKQKSGGSILFLSSVTGIQAHENLSAYGMTKAALQNLTKHLVLELSPYKIRVNAIAPGATITERTLTEEAYEKTWAGITPLGRAASIDDVSNAALFLLSERAAHITGQTLVIDGGWTVTSPQP